MTIIDIRYETIKAASYFMSKEVTRYDLNGVHVVSDGNALHIQATDGHRLVKITKRYEEPLPKVNMILSRWTISMITKLFARRDVLAFDFDKMKITVDNLEYPIQEIDGTFPDVNRIIPDYSKQKTATAHIGFNMELMNGFSTSLNQFGASKAAAKLSFKDEGSPMRLDASNCEEVYIGLLMPLRI